MSDLTVEQIAALKAQGFHFRATPFGEVRFTEEEEAEWAAETAARQAEVAAAPLPAEVPMHKISKAALITTWPGHDNLDAAIRATFASFPHPQNVLALAEYDRAANFVTSGATTQATKAALGMSDAQFRDLVLLAVSMA